MFSKTPRVEDRIHLNWVSAQPCTACLVPPPSDPHHITTVKAGGGDVPDNVMPLCRQHHTEWHQIGPGRMCAKYPRVTAWLITAQRGDILARAGVELW
jgi:hypothetical protein